MFIILQVVYKKVFKNLWVSHFLFNSLIWQVFIYYYDKLIMEYCSLWLIVSYIYYWFIFMIYIFVYHFHIYNDIISLFNITNSWSKSRFWKYLSCEYISRCNTIVDSVWVVLYVVNVYAFYVFFVCEKCIWELLDIFNIYFNYKI